MDKLTIKGAIFGVPFQVTLEKASRATGRFHGTAGGHPVDVTLTVDEDADTISASGTLLGNEFTIADLSRVGRGSVIDGEAHRG